MAHGRPARRRDEDAESVERSIRQRVGRLDVEALESALDEAGHARIPGLLRAAECRAVRALWDEPERFRKHVDLARHGFGEGGSYRYFASPLPSRVAALRRHLYPPLARIANRWHERLGDPRRFPRTLAALQRRCREHGQREPTPLVLDYAAGGYNCLHQDLYGEVYFPLQVAVALTRPERDFTGGEFLLVEQRPRMQSRGEAVAPGLGEAVVFPTVERPVRGARGWYRVKVRHGVSRVHSGHRTTLGIIFHDARK